MTINTKVVFCPKCHKRINVPKMLSSMVVLGKIELECADKNCGGKVIIKPKKEGG